MNIKSLFIKKINSADHSGLEHQSVDSFWDFISTWNFLNITNINGIISLVFLTLIISIYLVGVLRLVRNTDLGKIRITSITIALFLLFFVLEGPVDHFADEMFFIHMIQHLTLMIIVAPLLLLSNPMPMFIWGIPKQLRKMISRPFSGKTIPKKIIGKLTQPKYSLTIYIIDLYFWHIPLFYNASLHHVSVHFINHIFFFATSILFWWPIIGPAPVKSKLSVIQKIIYLLVAITPSAVLAAFITFSGRILYDYTTTPLHWNVASHIEDQTLGGIIMWLPGNFLFFGILVGLFFLWAKEEEKDALPKSIDRHN